MWRAIFISFIFSTIGLNVFGQDPFFSQFYNAPLTLNPALTGISYGNIRVGANYRNHFTAFDPFETYAFSMDMSILENSMKDNFAGIGFLAVKDFSGIGLENTKAMASFSFHKAFGNQGKHYLALGGQAGVDQTNLRLEDLTTQSQWVAGSGLDQTLQNGESFGSDNSLLIDFQAGMMWYSFVNDRLLLFAGSSVFHITEPEKTFLDQDAKLARRMVGHAGGKIKVGTRTSVVPNIVYMEQASKQVINGGLLLEYDLSNQTQTQILTVGGWLRNRDIIIANVGLEIKSFQIGLSYDVFISDVNTVSQRGGLEISLSYSFQKNIKSKTDLIADPNPRF